MRPSRSYRIRPVPERGPVGFGRRDAPRRGGRPERVQPVPGRCDQARRRHRRGAHPGAAGTRPQGLVRQAAGRRGLARLRRRGAARLPGGRVGPGSASSPWPSPNRSSRCSRRRSSRRRRWPCPRTTSRRSTRSPPWPGSSITSTTRSSSVPGCGPVWPPPSSCARCWRSRARPTSSTRHRSCSTPRRLRSMATMDRWWDGERRPAVLTPHAGRVRAAARRERRPAAR